MKYHNEHKHFQKPLKYRSAVTRNISEMLKKRTSSSSLSSSSKDYLECKPVEEVDVNTSIDLDYEPPSKKVITVTDHREEISTSTSSLPSTSQDDPEIDQELTLAALSDQLKELSSNVNQLVNQNNQLSNLNKVKTTADTVPGLNSEQIQILLTHDWSLQSILQLLGSDFVLIENGVKCIPCGHIFNYDMTDGIDFPADKELPRTFCNFKLSLKRHINTESHFQARNSMKEAVTKEKEMIEKGKECGLNCASAAYTGFYFSESRYSCEHHIADIYSSGGNVG